MRLELNVHTKPASAELLNDGVVVRFVDDSLDLIANTQYLGARQVITRVEHFSQEFFELQTGLAGDVLQKFSNYRMKLVIKGR